MLRARLTRYQQLLAATLLLGLPIILGTAGPTRWWLLSALCTVAGSGVGLGVFFPALQMFGRNLCVMPVAGKVVALTFDDGPSPETTPALLSLLAARGARATFFCVGRRVAENPDLVRRMVAEGHRVENHSYDHLPWTNVFSIPRLRADLDRAQQAITAATGRPPIFFRPPMCLTNPRVFRVTAELGLQVAAYTSRGLDRRPDPPERIVARLLRGLRPGAILLLHDGGVPAARLLAVTERLLDELAAAGYQCRCLDEMRTNPEP